MKIAQQKEDKVDESAGKEDAAENEFAFYMKDENLNSELKKLECSTDKFKEIIKTAKGNCQQRLEQITTVNKNINQFVLRFDADFCTKLLNNLVSYYEMHIRYSN